MSLWTAGILAALGLTWLVGTLTVSVRQTGRVLAQYHSGEEKLKLLGGSKVALRRLHLYVALPRWLASDRDGAVAMLGLCGPEAAPTLKRALADPDDAVRWCAACSLVEVKSDTPECVAIIAQGLKAQDVDRRTFAAGFLGRTRSADSVAVPALATAVGDPDERVRVRAAESLGWLRTRAGAAVPALILALKSTGPGPARPWRRHWG